MPNLQTLKAHAWPFYNTWRKSNGSYCPAFKSRVLVTLKAWRHITGSTGYKKRNGSDVYRRLMLIPYAKNIIEASSTIQNETTRHGRHYFTLEAMVDVHEDKKPVLRKVRVIIEEDKSGNKILLSVMDKKQK